MSRSRLAFASLLVALTFVTRSRGAEDNLTPPTITAGDIQFHQYFYVDFPRRLQAIDHQTVLAEQEVRLLQDRVDGYRPFRSFGRYAAAYTADRIAQLHLLAAQQRLICLQNAKADLWRERHAVTAAYLPAQ